MEATYKCVVNDRGRPLFTVLKTADGTPVDLASSTVTFTMKTLGGTSKVSAQSCTVHPTQTFTAATTDLITAVDHKAKDGDQIIVSNSGGALPTGLSVSTRYFVRDANPNSFKVSATSGAEPIDITATGSGTHSFYILGSVQYLWASGDTDTANEYSGFFQETVGGLVRTYPASSDGIHRGFPITITAL